MSGQGSAEAPLDFASLDDVFSSPRVAERLRQVSKTSHDAAAAFWRVPLASSHLSARMKELILFAMHVSATALNIDAVRRQIERVQTAGGTAEDILDVLITTASLASHSLYAALPVLEEELATMGNQPDVPAAENAAFEETKRRFIEIRGFWNPDRDPIARQMPEYLAQLTAISTESWQRGSLSMKEREFICIGIDCTVTHSYPPGLRLHIRNAIKHGATREEILSIFQLAGLIGLEGYIISAEALFGERG
jgi:alkylhydroperoxidase/carboxymuconolactone decarboxylase family protein YurZ